MNPPENPPPTPDLEAVRQTLLDLERQSLPSPAAGSLHALLEQLTTLQGKLAENEQQARLAGLYRVSQSLGQSLNLSEALEQVMDAVIELTGAERGFLMLLDPDTGALHLQAGRNIEQKTLESSAMEISRSVVREVLENNQGIITTNAQTDPRFSAQESVIAYALRSIMCTPLQSRGQSLGVVYVDNRALVGGFSVSHLNLLDTFAAQAAIVIENARLYTRTDQSLNERVRELETLSAIDRELNASLDLEHVIDVILNRLPDHPAGLLLLVREGGDSVWHSRSGSLAPPDHHGTMASETSRTGLPAFSPAGQGTPARSLFPLTLARRTLGWLYVESPDELPEAVVAFLQRLAARSAVAIENARLYQAVQDANLAKSHFVSFVSHELRLPMTSIKGYTDLILHGATGEITEQQTEFLQVVLKNVERMNLLVSDLSDISRIETGRLKLVPEPIVVEAYIEQTLLTMRPRIEEKRQELVLRIAENLPEAHADPNRVGQVLTNLISNASKYTLDGGSITVSASAAGGKVRVEVADTGIGISLEDQARLFTQFFRSEDPHVREQQGWGLGLNVTRNLVELMGGEIGLRSTPGKGSRFWFTLPQAGMK